MAEIKRVLFSEEEIQKKVNELGEEITKDYKGKKVFLLGILKGAVPFMADLMRKIDLDLEYDFMDVSSYEGTASRGEVRILKDISTSIDGKNILIVEDIIDTGVTLSYLSKILSSRGAASIEIVTLLSKPERRKVDLPVKYNGFVIEDEFVIGYGMDFNEKYRGLPYIGILDESQYK
ncbi:hypoxanthine phosphoribosyltransferase [Peptoniphilus sp. MSJ-1]|uniref:Hypoxanthine phosphoribosyltransferase n=1 Tax=Peptoniphilus ovalis TaxID=2841503 RepID=A0ABS6FFH3_9FIRM|nr:hypoxanthine phosphoribosyltransferase [Peptoniphilus ovalis]MBU5668915.1 hypoxanthine phosphoribosyltransferase [Peptoniphilus ovalis]